MKLDTEGGDDVILDDDDVQIGSLGIDGFGDTKAIMAEQKQGGKCCMCCCDYRRAVIILSLLSVIMGFIGFRRQPNADTPDETLNDGINHIRDEWRSIILIFNGIGIVMSCISFWAALKYQWKVVRSSYLLRSELGGAVLLGGSQVPFDFVSYVCFCFLSLLFPLLSWW